MDNSIVEFLIFNSDFPIKCHKSWKHCNESIFHKFIFICRCGNRYTHANRTCPAHPYNKPQRSNDLVLQPTIGAGEDTMEVQKWLDNYRRERMDKTPAKNPSSVHDTPVSPIPTLDLGVRTSSEILAAELCKRNRIKRGLVNELEQENMSQIPIKLANNW